jgi:HlyD family secretion protein
MANGRNTRRVWIVLAIIVVLVALVGLASRKKAPQVLVVKVIRQELISSITSNGKVEPISPAVVRAQFPTFVDKVFAVEGQTVHRGETILTLASSDLRAQLAQAQGDLLSAQTQLRNAQQGGPPDQIVQVDGELRQAQIRVKSLQHDQQVLQELLPKHAATQDEIDQNQTALLSAQASVETAQKKKEELKRQAALDVEGDTLRVQEATNQVKSLQEKVDSATVIAPMDGTLYSLPVKTGDYVTVGQLLAEMADLRRVRVRAFVDEPDLGRLAPSETVQITWDARPNLTWEGRTEQVPKQVVPLGNRSVGEVLCSVDNSRLDLLPNVNVTVRILVSDVPSALVVPRVAVRTEGDNHYVFLFSDDHLHEQQVSVGVASTAKYQLLSGVSEGEWVALPGDLLLKNGMAVRGKDFEE